MAWDESLRTIATLAGVAVAWYGVNTWRRQLRGNVRHEVARALLRAGLRLRDQIHAARSVIMDGGEIYLALKESGSSDAEIREKANAQGFEAGTLRRIRELWVRVGVFDEQRAEAEVLWGTAIVEQTGDLRELAVRLTAGVSAYFRLDKALAPYREGGQPWPPIADRIAAQTAKAMETMHGDANDDFGRRVVAAAGALEVLLRPHLGPKWADAQGEASRWREGLKRASAELRVRVLPTPRDPRNR